MSEKTDAWLKNIEGNQRIIELVFQLHFNHGFQIPKGGFFPGTDPNTLRSVVTNILDDCPEFVHSLAVDDCYVTKSVPNQADAEDWDMKDVYEHAETNGLWGIESNS